MPKPKVVAATILVVLMLLSLGLVPLAFAESTETTFHNVTVDLAYDMITDESFPYLVVLDVRYQSEYDMGHLYDAVLIPYDELETRIGELEDYRDHEIVVYCKSGYRSEIACEILADRSFRKVYNMLGGILAWIEAGYPIYTTFHHVTVNTLGRGVHLETEPLLLLQTGCTSCAENQSCPSGNEPTNIQSTVLEQEENHTVILLTYEVNGTTFEFTVAKTLLWSYDEVTYETSKTAELISTEITTQDEFWQFYSLSYLVRHEEYNLTLYTDLTPLDSETYNSSSTVMNYASAGKSEIISLEFVEFNSSMTLSQVYAVLGEVAKEMGKIYEKSGDETLAQLAQNYYVMEGEAKNLSKLVEKQLPEYDRKILESSAILMDAWEFCSTCRFACQVAIFSGCAVACFFYPPVCVICVALVYYANVVGLGCAVACILLEQCPVPGTNRPPETPSKPSGPTSGFTYSPYSYSTHTTDPDGNKVRYEFNWGDGYTTLTDFYSSGSTATASHYWHSAGTYYVKVRAQDSYGTWSGWSSSLKVTIYRRSGPCPILSVWNGSEYVEEGTLNIHACEDVLFYHTLTVTPKPEGNAYLLRLTEPDLPNSHSYIDQVTLLAYDKSGNSKELRLIGAVHSEYGNVLSELLFSDDTRTDTLPYQTIDLKFLAPIWQGKVEELTFVIEGYNRKPG